MNVPTGLGELGACPHCGGQTRLEPSPTLRWVCGACGGARVPGLEPHVLARDLRIAADLVRAKRARDGRAILRGVSFLFAAMAVMALLPIAIAWPPLSAPSADRSP